MKKSIISTLIAGSFLITGCTYKTATIKYNDYNAYSQNLGGNRNYKEIAPIRACASGFVWEDCVSIASNTLETLNEKSKALGGNGVIKVKWVHNDQYVITPTCVTQWGWFALYILPGFGPWVQRACAEGIAVKFIDQNNTK
ncbi:hypothetical protein JCM11957_09900 [Caminibacter profundus]